ncbi:YkvS family protein, partial [Escherichia coli]|nr:YkvS family protein [Escherichia coli]
AKAHVGDIIEFKDGLTGIVEKLNENSVIVDLTYMENFKDLGIEEKTVVNHKNYQIIHSVEEDDEVENAEETEE